MLTLGLPNLLCSDLDETADRFNSLPNSSRRNRDDFVPEGPVSLFVYSLEPNSVLVAYAPCAGFRDRAKILDEEYLFLKNSILLVIRFSQK